jgi:hypothetical protein
MLGIIPRPLHAVLDYLWSIALFCAPELVGFADDDAASTVCKARAGGATAMSLLTRYELGLIKVIPFNVHLLLDLLSGLMGQAAPWLFGYARTEKARNTSIAFSLLELGAVALSKRDGQ